MFMFLILMLDVVVVVILLYNQPFTQCLLDVFSLIDFAMIYKWYFGKYFALFSKLMKNKNKVKYKVKHIKNVKKLKIGILF